MLSHKKQKYIKKHLSSDLPSDIAKHLEVSEQEVHTYIQKQLHGRESPIMSASWRKITKTPQSVWNIICSSKLIFVILTVIICISYANALRGEFLQDDIPYLVNNPHMTSFQFVLDRPMTIAWAFINWLTYLVGGLHPIPFHIVNIVLHTGVTFALYVLVAIMINKRTALIAAAIAAVHPIATEAVTWIVGGTYVQYSLFFLLSMITYIVSIGNKRWYIASLIFFTLMLASCEKSIPMSLAFVTYELAFGNLKKNWKRVIPFVALTMLWLFFIFGPTQYFQTRVAALQKTNYDAVGIFNPFVQIPIATSIYLDLIVWPDKLAFFHSQLAFPLTEYMLRLLAFISVAGIMIASWFGNRRHFFWLSVLFISLSPSFSPIIISWMAAERYVYLGALGVIVLIAYTMDWVFAKINKPTGVYLLLGILVAALTVRTVIRNNDWKDQYTLSAASLKTAPNDARLHNNIGVSYYRQQDYTNAQKEFAIASRINPKYAGALYNMSLIADATNQPDQANEYLMRAIRLDPNFSASFERLASKYYDEGKYTEAKAVIEAAIRAGHTTSYFYSNLGMTLNKLGDREKAKAMLRKAISLDNENIQAQEWLAIWEKQTQ